MNRKFPNWVLIVVLFLIWRTVLFSVAIIAPFFIPKFGAQFPYFNSDLASSGLPNWVWSFGNFDGVHYVRAALTGYESQYSQVFFPLYFLLIKDLSLLITPVLAGLLISNFFFLAGLIIFYKLLRVDFDLRSSLRTILFLLAFPTAFYFGAIYTESIFFFLTVSSLYFMRKGNLFHAGLLALLASATRIIGLLLFPIILWRLYLDLKSKKLVLNSWEGKKALIGVLIAPMGLLLYMLYLGINFNDPILFLNAQPEFGAQRSAQPFILLPQVLFRYFKILTTVSVTSQVYFNAALEFGFTLALALILFLTFKKTRKDYWLFSATALILPTMTGTLSSMPRYSLMAFLIFPVLILKIKNYYWWVVGLLIILQIILATIFLRGYWIA